MQAETVVKISQRTPEDQAQRNCQPGTACVAERTYVVGRVSADDFCVLDGVCTHGSAHLGGGELVDTPDGPQIQCPKHLGRFDARTGAPCSKPVRDPMGVHDATIESGHLIVTRAIAEEVA